MGKKEELENEIEKTFAEIEGMPGNAHAKKLAKRKAKQSSEQGLEGRKIFYTQKKSKVLKLISKPGKLISIYIGNLDKHKDAMHDFIKAKKEEGTWINEHYSREELDSFLAKLK